MRGEVLQSFIQNTAALWLLIPTKRLEKKQDQAHSLHNGRHISPYPLQGVKAQISSTYHIRKAFEMYCHYRFQLRFTPAIFTGMCTHRYMAV